jgi:pimeloyl-ACP methyl ester carboxylesterase
MTTPAEEKKTKPLWMKILFFLVALVVLLVISGFAFKAIASYQGAKKHPPEGKLVDVGDFKLHLQKQGAGEPTIIFENGSGVASTGWGDLPKRLSQYGTVVTYDRGGYAWSEEATTERTGANVIHELYTALKKEKIDGPYILVGHSLGGMYSRLFARTYPEEIGGIVLLDARPEDFSKETASFFEKAGLDPVSVNAPSADTLALLKRIGIIRLMEDSILPNLSEEEQDLAMNIELQPKFFRAQEQELDNITSLENSIRGQSLKEIPLTIITHGIPADATAFGMSTQNSIQIEKTWQDQQKQLLILSSDSKLIVAEKSGHFVMDDEPDLVFNAIKERVEQAKQ